MFKTVFGPTLKASATGSSSTTIRNRAAPLRRTKDALSSSANATHYALPSGSTFIVRAAPSVLPPTMSFEHDSKLKGTTHSFEHLMPLVKGKSSSTNATTSEQEAEEKKMLSPQEVEELQALRRSDPLYWTRARLAEKFGLKDSKIVGTLGYGTGPEARRAEKQVKLFKQSEQEATQARWGWKKTIAREERKRRRTMW